MLVDKIIVDWLSRCCLGDVGSAISGSHLTRQIPLGNQSRSFVRQWVPLAFRGAGPAFTASWEPIAHFSSKLYTRWRDINGLKAAMVAFSMWKLANSTYQGSPHRHTTVILLNTIVNSQSSSYLILHTMTQLISLSCGGWGTVFTQIPESCFSICFAHLFTCSAPVFLSWISFLPFPTYTHFLVVSSSFVSLNST